MGLFRSTRTIAQGAKYEINSPFIFNIQTDHV